MYLIIFLTGLLGSMSPGPDFVIVVKNSLCYGKISGIYTALGIALGLTIHVAYTIAGFTLVMQKDQRTFMLIQFLGALYLCWLGAKGILSKRSEFYNNSKPDKTVTVNRFDSFKEGLLCNVLNPKVALFFLSFFTLFFKPAMPQYTKWIYGILVISAAFCWFVFLANVVSIKQIRLVIGKYSCIIDRLLGVVLIALSLNLFWNIISLYLIY